MCNRRYSNHVCSVLFMEGQKVLVCLSEIGSVWQNLAFSYSVSVIALIHHQGTGILIRRQCNRERPKSLNWISIAAGPPERNYKDLTSPPALFCCQDFNNRLAPWITWIKKMDSQAVFGFDQLRRCSIMDLSHGSWLDSSGLNNQPSTRSLGSSKRGILALFGVFSKSSLPLLLVTLPSGGRVGLASTQMHAGIVFLFILSLPCRHVLFFFPSLLSLSFLYPGIYSLCVFVHKCFVMVFLFELTAHHQHYFKL